MFNSETLRYGNDVWIFVEKSYGVGDKEIPMCARRMTSDGRRGGVTATGGYRVQERASVGSSSHGLFSTA